MKAIKFMMKIIIVLLVIGIPVAAQDKPDTTDACKKMMGDKHQKMHEMMKDSSMHKKMHDMKMMKDSTQHTMMNMKGMQGMKHDSHSESDASIVRKGEIDLKVIDKNNDGKVFQCQMDFNVISDKPGSDPNCGMKLKELTLEQARVNLLKHDFKVKDLPKQR